MTAPAETLGVGALEAIHDRVAVFDMGAQLADVIRWELIEAGIHADLIPFTSDEVHLDIAHLKSEYGAFIFSGSGKSVHDEHAPHIPVEALDGEVPSLHFCYSAQDVAHQLGGEVGKAQTEGINKGEYGQTSIDVDYLSVIYGGASRAKVLMSHGDSILKLPEGYVQTGWSDDIVASYERADGRVVCTQFHPEVAETEGGTTMMLRFLENTAGIRPNPDYGLDQELTIYAEQEESKIAEFLESGGFIAGFLSGGVDSMVAAKQTLRVAKRLGRSDQVGFYYVDNGHTRTTDDKIIERMQAEGMPVEKIDAADRFFHERVWVEPKGEEPFLAPPLVEVSDPEIKRLIIGTMFRIIADEIKDEIFARTSREVRTLQGTNNSDLVESGGRGGSKVKGHHNVEAMEGKRNNNELVEPLHGLMKYHVRKLGEERYGLSEYFVTRQPFPGVGLSPRIVVNLSGELPPVDPETQSRLDAFIRNEFGNKLRGTVVGVKTVGQQGDDRSLSNMVILEGKPDWARFDHLSKEIVSGFMDINRVFFADQIEIDRDVISGVVTADDPVFVGQLKRMEDIHEQVVVETDLDPYLSQYFVGTLPVDLTGRGLPTLPQRMFITGLDHHIKKIRRRGTSKETFRTGVAARPGYQVDYEGFMETQRVLQTNLVDHGAAIYDLTAKPGGSTEWE